MILSWKSTRINVQRHNFEVLRMIAELQSKQVVYTGLIKEEIRRKGLAISERKVWIAI